MHLSLSAPLAPMAQSVTVASGSANDRAAWPCQLSIECLSRKSFETSDRDHSARKPPGELRFADLSRSKVLDNLHTFDRRRPERAAVEPQKREGRPKAVRLFPSTKACALEMPKA